MMHPDDYHFTYSTESEWDRAEAYEIGAENPDRAWICTDRDVWHANPFYKGPPVRHPEDDYDDYPTDRDIVGAYPDDLRLIDDDEDFDLTEVRQHVPLIRGSQRDLDDCIPF